MSDDSSEELFQKKTLRGRWFKTLGDDTEDLRREARRLQLDLKNNNETSTTEEDSERELPKAFASGETSDTLEDDLAAPAEPPVKVGAAFGTLRKHRKRNTRLLQEDSNNDNNNAINNKASNNGATSPRAGLTRANTADIPKNRPIKKAVGVPPIPIASKKSTSSISDDSKILSSSAPIQKPAASDSVNKLKSSSVTQLGPTAPSSSLSIPRSESSIPASRASQPRQGHVQNRMAVFELRESKQKQFEMEEKIAILAREKKLKEAELAKALERIKELEEAVSTPRQVEPRKIEIENHKQTARKLQESIAQYQSDIQKSTAEQVPLTPKSDLDSSSDDEVESTQVAQEEQVENLSPEQKDAELKEAKQKADQAKAERKKRTRKRKPKQAAQQDADSVTKTPSKSKSGATKASRAPRSSSSAAFPNGGLVTPAKVKRSKSTTQDTKEENPARISAKFNGVSWFKDYYLSACKLYGTEAIMDLLLIVDRAISKSKSIQQLDLNTYSLESMDVAALTKAFHDTFGRIATMNPNDELINVFEPTHIDLAYNNLTSGKIILDLLKEIGLVTSLDISHNPFGPKPILEFAEGIVSYKQLKSLKLSGNNIGPKSGAILLKSLLNSKNLEVLDLSDNSFDDRSAPHLATLIQQCPLFHLNIKYNKFKSPGMKIIIAAIPDNSHLSEIDFTSCAISSRAKQLFEVFEKRTNIEKLCIGFNKLSSTFVPKFISFAAQQKCLRHLDLRYINVVPKSMKQIIDALSATVGSTLQDLILHGNPLDSKCIDSLVDYISRCASLNTIGLRGCGISRDPMIQLLSLFKHNTSLKMVDLSGNRLNDRRVSDALASCLHTNKSIQTLSIAGTRIDAKLSPLIGQALQFNTTLERIQMDGNKLGERGLLDFADALTGNDVLRVWSIKSTMCTSRTLIALLAALIAKTQIEVLDAADNDLPVGNKAFREKVNQFDAIAVKL